MGDREKSGKSSRISVDSLDALRNFGITKISIAIGVFDGVHCGHMRLLDELFSLCEQTDSEPVVLTFHPHPRKVLNPDSHPSLLISQHKKHRLMWDYGVKAVITLPFTKDFAMLLPEEFINRSFAASSVEIRGICVGKGWRFGRDGSGGVEILEKYAKDGHFDFRSVNEKEKNGKIVSSTFVRRAVASGFLEDAELMLGRRITLEGHIIRGRKIAGKELSHPTANLKIDYGVLPPDGVYSGIVKIDKSEYLSAVAVGTAPTCSNAEKSRLEIHIIDFEEDIYDKNLELELIDYIREERCFPNKFELKKQIEEDIKLIRKKCFGVRS